MLELLPLQETIPVGGFGGLDWLSQWDGEAWALAFLYAVREITDWAELRERQETTRTEIREKEDWP